MVSVHHRKTLRVVLKLVCSFSQKNEKVLLKVCVELDPGQSVDRDEEVTQDLSL